MNKITKLLGALTISALATVGCKSEEPAPAAGTTGGTSTTTEGTAPGAEGSCGGGTGGTGDAHSCSGGTGGG